MQHVTLVKKVFADGRMCRRCIEVGEQLRNDGLMDYINHLVLADDSDADSVGAKLAQQFAIEKVPFFLVDDGRGKTHVFQDYQQFKQYMVGGQ